MPILNNQYVYVPKLFICGGDSVSVRVTPAFLYINFTGAYVVKSDGTFSNNFFCDILCPNEHFVYMYTAPAQTLKVSIDKSKLLKDASTGSNRGKITVSDWDINIAAGEITTKTMNSSFYETTVGTQKYELVDEYGNIIRNDSSVIKPDPLQTASLYESFYQNCQIYIECLPIKDMCFINEEDIIAIKYSNGYYVSPGVSHTLNSGSSSSYVSSGSGSISGSGSASGNSENIYLVNNIDFNLSNLSIRDSSEGISFLLSNDTSSAINIIENASNGLKNYVNIFGLYSFFSDSCVGINTSMPYEKLTVNGNVRINDITLRQSGTTLDVVDADKLTYLSIGKDKIYTSVDTSVYNAKAYNVEVTKKVKAEELDTSAMKTKSLTVSDSLSSKKISLNGVDLDERIKKIEKNVDDLKEKYEDLKKKYDALKK